MKSVLTTQVCDVPFVFQNMDIVTKKCNKCQRDISPDEFYIKTVNSNNETFDIKYLCFNHIVSDIHSFEKYMEGFQTALDSFNNKLEEFKSDFQKIKSDFQKHDAKFIEMDERYKILDKQSVEIDERYKKFDEQYEKQKTEISDIYQKLNELNNKIVLTQSDKPKLRKKKIEEPVTLTVTNVPKIDV